MTDRRDGGAGRAESSGENPSGGEGREAFGELLTRLRESRHLSPAEAAAAVRIPVRYLEAMEAEDYGSLPPTPYVRGFLDA